MSLRPRARGVLEERGQRSLLVREVMLPVQEFIHAETTGGITLLSAAFLAVLWANSPWQQSYEDFWTTSLTVNLAHLTLSLDLRHWVNDGLMAVFFFVVGLEIKRELLHGELSNRQRAMLPLFAALGGMLIPALIFAGFNMGLETIRGWAVPVATDIAFALGVLALAGRGLPSGLRVFLLGLAIADDIGGILIIALFFTSQLSLPALAVASLLAAVIWGLTHLGFRSSLIYTLLGIALWFAVYKSGVHATIAGVVLGALVPTVPFYTLRYFETSLERLVTQLRDARNRGETEKAEAILGSMEELSRGTESTVERLEHMIHPWSSHLVVPAFALANAGVSIEAQAVTTSVFSPLALGIFWGLVLGKPLGIVGVSWMAVRLGIASLPEGVRWTQILGVGLAGGIGFTVSLFIATLSFEGSLLLSEAKMGILFGSTCAGIAGFGLLRLTRNPR